MNHFLLLLVIVAIMQVFRLVLLVEFRTGLEAFVRVLAT